MNDEQLIGYVAYEPKDKMVFVRLREGKIDLSVYLSNECSEAAEMEPVIEAWFNDTHPTIIAPHFSVSSPLDYLVDGHQMPAHGNEIDMDAKPVFDALRAELTAQVERIDALIFKDGQ